MNMNSVTRNVKHAAIVGVGAIVGGMTLFSTSASAQETSAQPEVMQGITIVAPYVVHRKVVGRSTIGAPIEVLSVSRSVSYADLDLTKATDADQLKKRISDTAKDACNFLFSRDREGITIPPVTSNRTCVKTATAEAMMLANDVIAASKS